MAAYLTGIVILLLLLYLNLNVSSRLIYPPVLFTLTWLVILVLHFLNQPSGIELYMLKPKTVFFLVGMVFLFSLGSFLVYSTGLSEFSKKEKINISPAYKVDKLFFILFNALSAVLSLLLLQKALAITSAYDLGPFLKELRTVINYHEEDYGILKYVVLVVNMNLFIRLVLINKVKQSRYSIVIAFLLALFVAFLNTGRTFIFFILIYAFSVWLFNQRIKFRTLVLATLVPVFFFVLMGFLTEKGASMEADRQSNVSSMYQSIAEYLLGPVTAFQTLLEEDESREYGRNTFRFFYKLLHDTGLTDEPPTDHFKAYTQVPFKTNVYTVYEPYYKDFGVVGICIIMLLLGGFYGWLYYNAKQRRLFAQFFLFLFINPLLMSFFADMYFYMLSTWIQYLLMSLLVFGLFVHRYKE